MDQQQLVTLLVKLAVAASLASILVRLSTFKRMLLREERTLPQRVRFALALAALFGAGVVTRIATGTYKAVDLGLEGSLLAGLLGGYVTGLLGGVLISLPALILNQEYLTILLFGAVGLLGALLRDLVPSPEDIWRFSPFDLDLIGWLRRGQSRSNPLVYFSFISTCAAAEFLRWALVQLFGPQMVFTVYPDGVSGKMGLAAVYLSTLFAVTLPLKIWNNSRNEDTLEQQRRLLNEARLSALMSQINPHFLFNTLNSIASLIRINQDQARGMIYRLSNILRRAMRHQESVSPLREELAFIDDYMAIELIRFGDKLRFIKEVDPDTLDRLVPSMLLQPLIENSIRHGLSSKIDGGMIRVRSRIVENRLFLSVEDDGVGIPEAKMPTLFEQGIGIGNVNERLKVLYGDDYRMWIESKPGQGTQTEIELPELRNRLAAAS